MKEEEDPGYLPLFITEPVYLFDEEEPASTAPANSQPEAGKPAGNDVTEVQPAQPAVAPEPEPVAEKPAQPAKSEEPVGERTEEKPVTPAKPLPFQGRNEKSIVLAIDTPPDQEQRDLLKKIMASVNITGKDVAMTDVTSLQDPASLPPHKLLISFGVENPLLFGGSVPQPYEIVKIEHQSFVLADSLSILCQEVSAKKNLWETLKNFL
ncbi:MAG: hypothetical protein WBB45_18210 [Cyclobacteriaceae bacterium]